MATNNPFDQFDAEQVNPFDQFDEEGSNPFDAFDGEEEEDDKHFLTRLGQRATARGQESIGGGIRGIGEAVQEPKTYLGRVKEEFEEAKMRDVEGVGANISEFARAAGQAAWLPWDATFGAAGKEALQGVTEPIAEDMIDIGEGIAESGAINLEEAGEYPYERPDSVLANPVDAAQYYGANIAESLLADMLPSMAVGYINPTAGLTALAAKVWGEEYGKLRAEGKTVEEAQEEATFRAAAEAIPEAVPMGLALKPFTGALKKTGNKAIDAINKVMSGKTSQFVGVGVAEGASEMVTEVSNVLYDKYQLGEEISFEDFQKQMKDAALMGFGMGVGMRGGALTLEQADKWVREKYKKAEDPGKVVDENPSGGGYDLNTMGQVNATIDQPSQDMNWGIQNGLETIDLNQPIQHVEAEDGAKLEPLDLDQPLQPDPNIPDPGTIIPDPGTEAENPFDQFDNEKVIETAPEDNIDVILEERDVTGLEFDDLQDDGEFGRWIEHQVQPMRDELSEMRLESPDQIKAQKQWRKDNKATERPLGWNVNPAVDNLLTVVAKHGGLSTTEWVAEHGVDIKGMREKGGQNWVAGAAQPLFSKYKKAMTPDGLAEFMNQSGAAGTYSIPDKYLENGELTANTVGELIADAVANPEQFGMAEFHAAKEFEANIERTIEGFDTEWRNKQEKKAFTDKFESGNSDILADMEQVSTHDDTFYNASWDFESNTLLDWVAEAAEVGATDAEIETATKGKDAPAKVRALNALIEAKQDERIDEQLAETFNERPDQTRTDEEGGGPQAETVSDEVPQPPDPLTEDVSKEQALADAQAEKDKTRDGEEDVSPETGDGGLLTGGKLEEDMFPGTTLEGEQKKPQKPSDDTKAEDTSDTKGDDSSELASLKTRLQELQDVRALPFPEQRKVAERGGYDDYKTWRTMSKLEVQEFKARIRKLEQAVDTQTSDERDAKQEESKDETVEELKVLFQKKPYIGVYMLTIKAKEGVKRADEALSEAGFVEIPFGKSTIFVNPKKKWTAFSRSQGQGSGVLVQYGKATKEQIEEAVATIESIRVSAELTKEQEEADKGETTSPEAVAEDALKAFDDRVAEAARWKGAAMKLAESFDTTTKEGKKAAMALSRATTKADLDAYLMKKYGIDESDARNISNELTAKDIPADATAKLEDFADQPWAGIEAEQVTEELSPKADKVVPKKSVKADKKQGKKLENTGADLRRHWDKLKSDLENARSDGEKAWKLIHGKTMRAKLFNPKPGEGATPGVQRYYNEVQNSMYTFSQIIEKEWYTRQTQGYYGTPMAEQVARMIDDTEGNQNQWRTAATLADLGREYQTMLTRVAEAISGAKTVEEAEALVAKIVDTEKLSRWSDPTYLDESMHITVPLRASDEAKQARKIGPFIGHGINKYLKNRKIADDERTKTLQRDKEGKYVRDEDGRTQSIYLQKNIPTPLEHLISYQTDEESVTRRKKSAHHRTRINKVERTVEKKIRTGNVTPAKFKAEFGFADIGFGTWVAKGKDQNHLNAAWDAFADMADRMGMPRKAVGFYGKLHFTIGALGHGKHAAHFQLAQPHPTEGTVPVINLTNTKGDGAIAHEWGHALDFLGKGDTAYVIDVIKRELAATRTIAKLKAKVRAAMRPGGPYMTRSGSRGSLQNIEALANYHINRRGMATSYKKEADKLGKDYWGSDVELFARAWEAYIFDTLEGENNYLVNDWVRDSGVGTKNGYKGYPYPQAEERAEFAKLFSAMIAAIDTVDGELVLNREKFDAKLPTEVKDFQAEAQKVFDSIPAMMDEVQAEIKAEKEARSEKAQAAEAEKWAAAAEKAKAEARLNGELEADQLQDTADAEAAGDIAGSVDPDTPLNEDQLEALFDQALDNVQGERDHAGEAPVSETKEEAQVKQKDRVPSEETTNPTPTASKLIKKAAEQGVTGIDEALTALAKLFPPNKLHSFPPTVDKETYDKAKPHFTASLAAFQKSGKTLVELFGFLINQMGAGIRPYLVFWAKEEGLSNNLKSTKVAETPAPTPKSLDEYINSHATEIHNNIQLKKLLRQWHERDATEAEIKAAQESLELALVRRAREIVQQGYARKVTIAMLAELYKNQPNLNSRSSTSMANQAYSTPIPLAFLASELSGINAGTTVYEPTAGNGALLIGANPVKTVVNELNSDRAQNLRNLGFAAVEFDATAWKPGSTYDAAIMNPPFGKLDKVVKVDGYSIGKIDHLIATKALENLNDDGRATIIIGANKDAGKTDPDSRVFLNWLYGNYNVVDHFEVSGDLYRKQGAGWPVKVITVYGRKASDQVFDQTVERYNEWSEINEHVTSVLGSEGFTGRTASGPVDTRQTTEDTGGALQPTGVTVDEAGGTGTGESGGRGTGVSGVRDSTGSDVVSGEAKRPGRDRADIDGKRPADERLPAADKSGAGDQTARPTSTQPGSESPRPLDKPDSVALGSEFQVHYRPGSAGLNETVLMPVNMRTAIEGALRKLTDEVGDLDAYVMGKLGYTDMEVFRDAFMALQVDAIASMIYNLENNNRGAIIADQTGVGKGRQAAAMIKYALKHDMVPVFVTAKANLFTDMYDDMLDIDELDAKPFIFNNDGGFVVDREGGPNKFRNKPAARKAGFAALLQGKMPAGTNMIMMTYSQANQANIQRNALDALKESGKKPMFIFDEAHNIAGDRQKYYPKKKEMLPTTAGWFFGLIEDQPVMYLSATYAKRPDNMPIYYRTDINDAVDDIDALEDAITAGGEALQTVVANMLAQSGQLWRRERSFDGIEFATTTFGYDSRGNPQPEKEAERKRHIELTDEATAGLREIVSVDNVVSEWLKDNGQNIVKELVGEAGGEMSNPGAMMESLMGHSPFTSRVHNFIKQLSLSLKADWVVEQAIAQFKAGKKPVIALENTMESFLKAEIKRGGAEMGKPWTGDYRSILRAALATTRRVTLTDKKGDKERVTVPLHMLPPNLQELYSRTENSIDKLPLEGVTLFYIDYIRNKLEEAGITTGEITGRSLMVDYKDGAMTVQNRPDSNKKFRRVTIDKFNNGEIDALILNAAGSTGLSIHASEKFNNKDGSPQKPRHMLVAQAMQDINILMQMFGRINRTGQIEVPSYEMMGLDLPSEQRPMAMTARKMRSLNAQTTANTESETSLNVASILNKYGDQVVKDLLIEQPDLVSLVGMPAIDDKTDSSGIAMKFTGKLALAENATQTEVIETIQERYSELMEWLDATNQNDLKTDVLDLNAKIIDNKTIYEGKDPTSIFGGNTVLHKITANVQGRPPSAYEMTVAVQEGLDSKTPGDVARALIEKVNESDTLIADMTVMRDKLIQESRDAREKGDDKAYVEANQKSHTVRENIQKEEEASREMVRGINSYSIGTAWKLDLGDDLVTGVVTGVEHVHKTGKGSPFSPSKLRVKFIVNSAARHVTIPLSKILKGEVIERNLYVRSPDALTNLFDSKSGTSARETRYVATGNLLGGYNSLEAGGRVISFTAANGQIYSGILMPRKFGKKGEYDGKDSEPVIMRDPAETSAYLRGTRHDYDLKRFGVFNLPNQEIRIAPQNWGTGFEVSVLRKRSQAGDRVKFDKQLHKAMGQEFVGRTQVLTVSITDEQLDAVVSRITELGSLYIPGSGKDALQRITGRERAEAAISFDGTLEDDNSLRETFEEADEGGLFDNSNGEQAPKFNLSDGVDFKVDERGGVDQGKSTFLSKQLEVAMAKFLNQAVKAGTIKQVDAPAGTESAVRVIERIFGRRVVFFNKDKSFPFGFNGVMLPRDPKTLYVNVASKNPFAGVLGHELLHSLRRTHPDLYKKLAQMAMSRLKGDGFDRFKSAQSKAMQEGDKALTADKMFEEMVANVLGDAFLDPSFINQLANEGRTFWEKVWNAVLDTLRGFQKTMRAKGMGTNKYFNHTEKLVKEVQTTLKNYRPSMPVMTHEELSAPEDTIFDEDLDTPDFSREDPDRTPAYNRFMQRAGMGQSKRTLAARVRDLIHYASAAGRQYLSDSIQMGLFDKFYGIKRAYRDYLNEPVGAHDSGYIAARLSTGAASVMQAMLLHGTPKYEGRVIEQIEGSKGLLDVFEPVKSELDQFMGWMIARRADRLHGEGKENNFTREEIDAGLESIEGTMEIDGETRNREEVYEEVAEEFATFKGAVLDLAENAGLIDATTRPMWDKADWIPFYRIAQDGRKGPKFGSGNGLSGQQSGIRKLTGGTEMLSDPLGNIIQNFNHLITASMKNIAVLKTVDDLSGTEAMTKTGRAFKGAIIPRAEVKRMLLADGIDEGTIQMLEDESGGEVFDGIAKVWAMTEPTDPNVIKVMRDGKPEFYEVHDPFLVKSLTNLEIEKARWLAPARAAKTLLTTMITSEPGFMMRNWIRDTVHAWVINEDHFKLGIDSIRGGYKAAIKSGGMLDMMFAGGSFQGGYINGTDPDAARKSVRKALRSKGYDNQYIQEHLDTVVDLTAGVWDKWRSVGDVFENASREAVYEAAIKAGKSKAQAIYEAKDLMDFSMHGSWQLLQIMGDVLPFFNARLQGLYKLGRSGAIPIPGLIAKEIAMKGMMVALFSWVLALFNDDNEEYEALEEWDKDTYWHFFPGTPYHIRMPKPFEVGFIYGTMAERMYRGFAGKDTGGKVFNRFVHGIVDTLAMNPTPQIFKPGAEVWANTNTFTDRPIEGMGDERKLKRDRYNARTSDIMVALGPALEKINLSPKQAEHMFRGYLGTLGNYSLMAADVIMRDVMDAPAVPTKTIRELPVVGSFVRGEGAAWNTRYGTELYEMHHQLNQIWASVKSYEAVGNYEKIGAMMEDKDTEKKLSARKGMSYWAKQRSAMRKQIDQIYRDENMSEDKKRDEIESIVKERNRMDAENYKYFSPLFDRK